MSYGSSTIVKGLIEEALEGLRDETLCFTDTLSITRQVRSIAGVQPIRLSVDSLRGKSGGFQALGANPHLGHGEMGEILWNLKQVSKKMEIPKQYVVDLEQYIDVWATYARDLSKDVANDIDAELFTLLSSIVENQEQAANNGVWALDTSTPVQDIQDAKLKCPSANIAVVGMQTALKLSRHPDLKSRTDYYVSGGSMPMSQLRSTLAEISGLQPNNIYIFGTYFNDANEGQPVDLAYHAEDLFFLGKRENLILFEQADSGRVTERPEHNRHDVAFTRSVDLVRADQLCGVTITGTV